MGMSIDDARREMISGKPYTDKFAMALVVAIDTMRKYKKIEQIIRNYDVAWEFHHMKTTIDEIREVIQDGKTD